ncbi:hypothetical protein V6U90_33230, partial [Micromonospora sp. CPCC 206060]|uniref:hypothetical protein n=1 Tax=Micromonospora sp. CPCC 206060 TaxID=3122406 RepID=UPI002FEEB110
WPPHVYAKPALSCRSAVHHSAGRNYLVKLLPEHFELIDAPIGGEETLPDAGDALWELKEQYSGYTLVLVEAKTSFTPRDVEKIHARLSGAVRRAMRDPVILVVAPWLSPRSRAMLEERGYSYLDLTGNVYLRVQRPAVFVRLPGAQRDPHPSHRGPARLYGPKARRLARLLVDVMPPLRLTDLARVGGLNRGYVSSLLQALDEQAVIERDRKGTVVDVDWPGLLTLAAARYDLLKTNTTSLSVAPAGAADLFHRLTDDGAPPVVVTGSFAASAVAPIAAPAQLVLYTDSPSEVSQFGRLLPTDRGADVVLLRPEDEAQLARARQVGGRRHVGLSQLALDCLGGNGRLPEEGEALIDWMREHESRWRLRDLPELDV